MSRAFEVPRRADLAAMFSLAVPVVVVQVGMMLMGVVDTMVVGRVSAEALAAVALGNLAVMTVSAFAIGLRLALDPVVAQRWAHAISPRFAAPSHSSIFKRVGSANALKTVTSSIFILMHKKI